jgi:hypothetical protein
MKKFLLTVLMITSKLLFCQISIIPQATHYNNPYLATIYGSGTIYYTTDGSTPTINSSSAVNNVQININQNKEIKAFVVNSQGIASSVLSKKYYVGTLPTSIIYFKPPSTWTMGVGVFIDMVNPNSVNGGVVDAFWPGFQMINTGCEGWYRYNSYYDNANVRFTNNSMYENFGGISTNLIPVGNLVYYDFSNGSIINPPSCLLLNTSENDKKNYTLLKVYPNPVTEILKISSEIDFRDYEILDTSGKSIQTKSLKSKEISVSNLVSGNYYLKLIDSKNNSTILKFIKK